MPKVIPFEKSFASHPKAIYWSNNNEGRPEDYALGSHKICEFNCDCGHPFPCAVSNITSLNRWCPYCSNPAKKLCGNCDICFNKSFASHPRAKNWSKKNKTSPDEVFKSSHKKFWFDCECGHDFEAILSDISNNNSWCSYCSNPPKKFCNDETCISCYNKKFISHERAKNWSSKNTISPNDIFKKSAIIAIFDCDKCGNEFKSKVYHISNGSWCPKCRYKTEDKLVKILTDIHPSIASQVKFDWCKNVKHLPFDFVLENEKIIIECDGEQHWKQVGKWKTPEHTRCRDLYKMKCANDNGYSVIRIIQEDIFHDKYDWLLELCDNIEKVINENRVQNIYMCKNNEYDGFDK